MAKSAGSAEKPLEDYPRPSVAVDVAVLTVRNDTLQVVVVDHRIGGSALPGTFLHQGERLADAASRALEEKAGLTQVKFSQLKVFDDPRRDERGWVLSVGHSGAVPAERIPSDLRLTMVLDGWPTEPLLFDHGEIVALAVTDLRTRYGRTLDPARLLGETFTVFQMRRLYQAVFGRPFVKDTFRRYVIGAIEPTGELANAFGRPAELFRKRPDPALPLGTMAFLLTGKRSPG